MNPDFDLYVEKLQAELDTAEAAGRKGVFHLADILSRSQEAQLRQQLNASGKYVVVTKECKQCKKGTWEVLVYFKGA